MHQVNELTKLLGGDITPYLDPAQEPSSSETQEDKETSFVKKSIDSTAKPSDAQLTAAAESLSAITNWDWKVKDGSLGISPIIIHLNTCEEFHKKLTNLGIEWRHLEECWVLRSGYFGDPKYSKKFMKPQDVPQDKMHYKVSISNTSDIIYLANKPNELVIPSLILENAKNYLNRCTGKAWVVQSNLLSCVHGIKVPITLNNNFANAEEIFKQELLSQVKLEPEYLIAYLKDYMNGTIRVEAKFREPVTVMHFAELNQSKEKELRIN